MTRHHRSPSHANLLVLLLIIVVSSSCCMLVHANLLPLPTPDPTPIFIDNATVVSDPVLDSFNSTLYIIERFAGSPPVTADANSVLPVQSVPLSLPRAVRKMANGDLLIVDTNAHVVRRFFSVNNTMSIVAGNGVAGSLGDTGLATSAGLTFPSDVVVLSSGEFVIVDAGNHKIRKVLLDGTITTVVGTGLAGNSGNSGPALGFALNNPSNVVANGTDLFISDTGNNRIVQLSGSTVNTVASSLNGPTGLAMSDNVLYFADSNSYSIKRLNVDGTISNVTGNGTRGYMDGTTNGQLISTVQGLCIDQSLSLYMADAGNNVVRKFDLTTSILSTVAGTGVASYGGDGGNPMSAQLNGPFGIECGSQLIVADTSNSRIRTISSQITTLAGGNGDGGLATSAFMKFPHSLALDTVNGRVIVSEANGNVVRAISSSMNISTLAGINICSDFLMGGVNPLSTSLCRPTGVTVSSTGEVIFSEANYNRIRRLFNGTLTTIAGSSGAVVLGDNGPATSALLSSPIGVKINAAGEILFADSSNSRVRKIDTFGVITTVVGNGISGFNGDGMLASATFLNEPQGIAITTSGEIFIADKNNHRIRKVFSNGTLITIAGTGNSGMGADGVLAAVSDINSPNDVIVTTSGEVIFTDTNNHRIRKILTTGIVVTIAGNGASGYGGDSSWARNASLNTPTGLAISTAGDIFFADSGNNMIRVLRQVAKNITCKSLSSTNPLVCSGHGVCIDVDNCVCNNGYNGTNCEFTTCNGIPSNGSVCSGHGSCIAFDFCSCDFGWTGQNCSIPVCYNISATNATVCSGNGVCAGPSNCICNSGYSGIACSVSTECILSKVSARFTTSYTYAGSNVQVVASIGDSCFSSLQNPMLNFQVFQVVNGSLLPTIAVTTNVSTPAVIAFPTVGNYSATLTISYGTRNTTVNFDGLISVVEYDTLFRPSFITKLSIEDITTIASNMETYSVKNKDTAATITLLSDTLATIQRNSSDLGLTSKIVLAFKVVSCNTGFLSTSAVDIITNSISNISSEIVTISKNSSSLTALETTAKNVLETFSNCFSVIDSFPVDGAKRIIQNVMVVASRTSMEMENILEMSTPEFVLTIKRNMIQNGADTPMNGIATISAPSDLKFLSQSGSLSVAGVTFISAEKLFTTANDGTRISSQFNSTNINQLNSTSSRVNIGKVMDINFLLDGNVMNLENMVNPFSIQFATNQSVLDLVSSQPNLSIKCMYWNESTQSWKANGCTTEISNSMITCRCNHTTKFSSFVEYTSELSSTTDARNLSIADIVISSVFILAITVILVGLVFTRNMNPTKSRWLLPFIALLSLLIELVFSDIVSNAVSLSTAYDAASTIKEVATMINVTFFVIAILNYMLLNVRYLAFRYMYEILAIIRKENLVIKNKTKWLRIFSSKMMVMILNAIVSMVVIAYFIIFICLRRSNIIDTSTYAKIMSASVFLFVMVFSLLTLTVFIIDAVFEMKYSQFATLLASLPTKERKVQLQRNLKTILKNFLIENDPLFFRREFIFYFIAIVFFIISYGIGFGSLNASNTSVIAYNIVELVFSTLFTAFLIAAFGGAVLVASLIKNRKFKKEDNENDEVMKIITNDALCQVFEQYAKLEFSLENILLLKKTINLKESLEKGSVPPSDLLSTFTCWQEDHIETNSALEVNLPHATKKQFTTILEDMKRQVVDLNSVKDVVDLIRTDMLLNVNDTFSRFETSTSYEYISENIEMKDIVGSVFQDH